MIFIGPQQTLRAVWFDMRVLVYVRAKMDASMQALDWTARGKRAAEGEGGGGVCRRNFIVGIWGFISAMPAIEKLIVARAKVKSAFHLNDFFYLRFLELLNTFFIASDTVIQIFWYATSLINIAHLFVNYFPVVCL